MKTRYLIAAAAVLVTVGGMIIAQPPVGTISGTGSSHLPNPDSPSLLVPQPPAPSPASAVLNVEAKPDDMTIDQLLEAVEKFREQKAELEKKERTFMKVLHLKAAKQKERIDSLREPVQSMAPVVETAPRPAIPFPSPSSNY